MRYAIGLLAFLLLASRIHAQAEQVQGSGKASAASAPSASQPRFDIWEFRVLGNTKLPGVDVEAAVYPFLGPQRNFDTVEAARAALEKAYHERGFGTIFVDIPEQQVDNGVVRLHVIEGKLERVRVTGARYFDGRIVRAEIPEARTGTVPNIPKLQKELGIANAQNPDLTVTPVLRAGSTPGTVDLELKIQDRLPLHGSLEFDNDRTPDTKPLRVAGSLSYDNIGQRNDSAALQYQTAPEQVSNVSVVAGTYVFKFGPEQPALSVYAVDSKSDVATIGTIGVLGTGDIFGTRLVWPIAASAKLAESISIGVDYKKFIDAINVTAAQTINTHVDYVPFSVNYTLSLSDDGSITSFAAGATFAPRGLASSVNEFALTRSGAHNNFFYIRGSAGRIQQLPWGFSAQLQLDAQASPEPLISNEEFTIGGVESVRGYLLAEELGDSGLRGSFEMRSPALKRPTWHVGPLYGYAFFDWASVEIQQNLQGEASSSTLRSTGLGLRFTSFEHFDAAVDWAHTLANGARTASGVDRWNFSVRYGF